MLDHLLLNFVSHFVKSAEFGCSVAVSESKGALAMRSVMFVNLVAYPVVVAQALAHLMSLSNAQRALSAPAYIELRHRINAVMTRRVPVVYSIALATSLLFVAVAFSSHDRSVLVTAIVALLCLGADVALMLRENVPINGVMDRWSTSSYPADWQELRAKWLMLYAYRQALMIAGFLSLLIGAVFQ
jgi:hypothetical protein